MVRRLEQCTIVESVTAKAPRGDGDPTTAAAATTYYTTTTTAESRRRFGCTTTTISTEAAVAPSLLVLVLVGSCNDGHIAGISGERRLVSFARRRASWCSRICR